MKLRILFFLAATIGLYLLLFDPLIALMQAHPLRFKADSLHTLRPQLLRKLTLLQHAKRSPLLAHRATQSQQALLRLWLSPSKLHRTYRAFLQKGSLSAWHTHESSWRNLVDDVQQLLPNERLRYLHAFLDLQTGAWERLTREASRHFKQIPNDPRDALYWFWVGHAAFFAGNAPTAHSAYQKALRATQDHPAWASQTRHNWRIPGEILVARYHLALLYLPHQPHHALPLLQQNLLHWNNTYKQPERSPLWYHSLLWLAIAQLSLQDHHAATQSLHQALRFPQDTSLARWMLAQFSPPHQARFHLNAILQSPPHFPFAPPDIQAAARLLRGLLSFPSTETLTKPLPTASSQPSLTKPLPTASSQPALTMPLPSASSQSSLTKPLPSASSQPSLTKPLPSASSRPATARPPCLPIPTDALADLDHALAVLQRPKHPHALSHLYQRGNYSFAYSVLPTDLLQRWLQHLCAHSPADAPRRAALQILLSLQAIRAGHLTNAAQRLHDTTIAQHFPQHQRALHTLLQRDLAPLPVQSSPTSPSILRLRTWFYALGFDGCLAIDPTKTTAHTRCHTLRPHLFGHPTPMQIFASPLISHAPDRFSLLTLRLKAILLQHWTQTPQTPASAQTPQTSASAQTPPTPLTLQPQHIQRRLHAVQRLYREIPHASYLLDQTTYSLAWGTLAFSFHPPL